MDAKPDRILVSKSQHLLTVFQNGKSIKTYRVALGRGYGKPKRKQGDHETPEGKYIIDGRNDRSHFHRALHVSYPNQNDRKLAAGEEVAPGGDIMIHGIRNGLGWIGSLQRYVDWTDGCIALTDAEIDDIWRVVPIGTPIEIIH